MAYPNPARDQMNFMFRVMEDCDVKVEIYNMNGEKIAEIEEFKTASDNAVVTWNCSDVAAGIYLVKTSVGDKVLEIKKIGILK
ncbi:T9SS type A sorting domain-containing protein [bacterium]|nr:T9SS type A sorting domain-containing protein [bacterium]